MTVRRAIVVVPARDEQARIGACLDALAHQWGVDAADYEIVVVLDACTDDTAGAVAAARERHPAGPSIFVLHGDGSGAGVARKLGMDLAASRLLTAGRPRSLIASTDADTIVAPNWLRTQLDAVAAGARAIGGRIDLDRAEAAALPAATLRDRERNAARRLAAVRAEDPTAEHHHFAGASLGLTAATYRAVGGLEHRAALEDENLGRRLREAGVPIARLDAVHVTTSARRDGRASRGLARDLELAEWRERRTYDGAAYTVAGLLAAKRESVSIVLPAREVAATVGRLCEIAVGLREAGVVDEVVVVDADSRDGTARIAAATGATVVHEDDLLPAFGPCRGKGDAMWRSLVATTGELVAFLDADSVDPSPQFVLGLLGPAMTDPSLALVKGAFARPFAVEGGGAIPDGGGRVTELCARPLLNLHAPRLAGFEQPLAGEMVARRSLLEAIPFPVGYGVEIAMLLDALALEGLDALGQVRLGARQNRHQSLRDLGAMAYAVMAAAQHRIAPSGGVVAGPFVQPGGPDGADVRQVPVDERPPLASLRAALGTAADRTAVAAAD